MIKIDLKNLTDDMIAEARPNMGKCRYSAPCIIGALLTPEERVTLDTHNSDMNNGDTSDLIGDFISTHVVKFASPWQESLARRLQRAFDQGEEGDFNRLLTEIKDLP